MLVHQRVYPIFRQTHMTMFHWWKLSEPRFKCTPWPWRWSMRKLFSSAMISWEHHWNMLGISSINIEKTMQKYKYIYVIYIYIPPISNTAYSWVQICVNPQQNTKVSGACWIWTGEGIKELSPLYWNHFQDGFPISGNLDTKNAWQIKLE